MYYVYVVQSRINNSLYIGYTEDLRRRMKEHRRSQLVYYESYHTKTLARAREKKLKQYGSAWSGLKKRILK
ncbi:GIY-YIG nuclease family protein [Patescibacteria group bacterium]|nr:GIY-YIG nuclease family protein [Patescibacteria group bacterium]